MQLNEFSLTSSITKQRLRTELHFSSQRLLLSSGCTRWSDYLKECLKWTLLRLSFSGSWEAMWENSLKMSRYVASPARVRERVRERNVCENDITQPRPIMSQSSSVSQKHPLTFYEAFWRKRRDGGVNGGEKTASLFQPRPKFKPVPLFVAMVILSCDKSSWTPLCAVRASRLR